MTEKPPHANLHTCGKKKKINKKKKKEKKRKETISTKCQ
jgi:hypothetical protein